MSSNGVYVSTQRKQLTGMKISPKPSSTHQNVKHGEIASESLETTDVKLHRMMTSEDNDDVIQHRGLKASSFGGNSLLRYLNEGPFREIASELFFDDREVFDSKILVDEMYLADNRFRLAFMDIRTKAETRFAEISEEAKGRLEEIKATFETESEEEETAEEMERLIKKFIDKYRQLTLSCLYAEEKALNLLINEWLRANCDIVEKEENKGNLKDSNIRFNETETRQSKVSVSSKSENVGLKLVIFAAILSNVAYMLILKVSPVDLPKVHLLDCFSALKERIVVSFKYFARIPNSTLV